MERKNVEVLTELTIPGPKKNRGGGLVLSIYGVNGLVLVEFIGREMLVGCGTEIYKKNCVMVSWRQRLRSAW